MSAVLAVLGFAGAALLFVLRAVGILLAVVLVLALLALLCPFCADFEWEGDPDGDDPGTVRVKIGALGLTFPIWQYPAPPEPEPPAGKASKPGWMGRAWAKLKGKWAAWRQKRAAQKPPKPKKAPARPRQKARLTLHILCTILRGAGRLTRAVFDALRVTKIHLVWPVGAGAEPDEAARAYGSAHAWLYGAIGGLNRFIYLDFEELRLVPCIQPDAPVPPAKVSFRVSARALFIFIAAVRVLVEFYREKVLDVFL